MNRSYIRLSFSRVLAFLFLGFFVFLSLRFLFFLFFFFLFFFFFFRLFFFFFFFFPPYPVLMPFLRRLLPIIEEKTIEFVIKNTFSLLQVLLKCKFYGACFRVLGIIKQGRSKEYDTLNISANP